MAPLPPPTDTTLARIWQAWEAKNQRRDSRRLGASIIGRECDRQLWYSFRWAKKKVFEGRMLRLFARGNLEEATIVADLKAAGVQVMDLDPDTGQQWEFSTLGDHVVCKLDAACVGLVEAPTTWHVCEFKTHNDKSFSALEKGGVLRAKPEHFAQMQMGMGLSGMDRGLYVAVNKNDDSLYLERLSFDKGYYNRLLQRAKEIVFGTEAPDRMPGASPAHFKCKFCDFHGICHETGELAERNCRTCRHSIAIEDGGWGCDKHQKVLSLLDQQAGCWDHTHRAGMVHEAANKVVVMFGGKVISEKENAEIGKPGADAGAGQQHQDVHHRSEAGREGAQHSQAELRL
jgi:general stress protein YciG